MEIESYARWLCGHGLGQQGIPEVPLSEPGLSKQMPDHVIPRRASCFFPLIDIDGALILRENKARKSVGSAMMEENYNKETCADFRQAMHCVIWELIWK